MSQTFLSSETLLAGGPYRLPLAIERLLGHLGFDDVRNIDGSGDGGGDILAVRGNQLFVFQCKWSSRPTIGAAGVSEVETAKTKYRADRAVLVTNAMPDRMARARQRELAAVGVKVDFWSGDLLPRMFDEMPAEFGRRFTLRPYQTRARDAIVARLSESGRALLVLATGLGKTVVAGEVLRWHHDSNPMDNLLVVAHMKELIAQLERALWPHLPKSVPSQVLTGEQKPVSLDGLTCATIESALRAAEQGYRPGIVMVDETHHVSEEGELQRLLDLLTDARQFGVTATPWRGDEYDISRRFGDPCFKMGIAEGMAGGFLAQADYHLYVDDLDWDFVRDLSTQGYSVRELNEQLFLPQRDEAMIDVLLRTWATTPEPRAIIFCNSIEHAERMADLISRVSPAWRRAACLHSRHGRRERNVLMSEFRLGRVPIVTVVDIFNEGVDVPDVNIIAFLRVTHSRRIFVQQLGRGLRIRPGKDRVTVLDFVTDIRRVAAVLQIRRSLEALRGAPETVVLPTPTRVSFSDQGVERLMDAWIRDASDLETASDDVRLQFPAYAGGLN